MKFRMFTEIANGEKVAVNIDSVAYVDIVGGKVQIHVNVGAFRVAILVKEDFDIVFSRLNTVAD